MIGIDDSGHNIAPNAGTNLVKKVGVAFTGFGIGMVADFKREVQSAVTTVRHELTRGPRSRPIHVAPHKGKSGANLLKD